MRLRIPKNIQENGNLFFTSDEHFDHTKIIEYSNRPFDDVSSMNSAMIERFNEVVPKDSLTIHGGDFYLGRNQKSVRIDIVSKMNGDHVFLNGSHDKWLRESHHHEMVEILFNGVWIIVCHYAMRVWPKSHYNSIHLYGHSHGRLDSIGKSMDIGVDTNNFFPYSYSDVITIMENKPDNPNLIKK